jgi:hypothetical protein
VPPATRAFFKPHAPAAPPISRRHGGARHAKRSNAAIERTIAASNHMIPITKKPGDNDDADRSD